MAFKIFDRLTLLAIRSFLKELVKLRKVLESGVDAYRWAHGMSPLYSTAKDWGVEEEEQGASGSPDYGVLKPGDFLSVWLIEELARELRVKITAETNLEQLALDRGWISPDGQFLMLPRSAATEVPAEMLAGMVAGGGG